MEIHPSTALQIKKCRDVTVGTLQCFQSHDIELLYFFLTQQLLLNISFEIHSFIFTKSSYLYNIVVCDRGRIFI